MEELEQSVVRAEQRAESAMQHAMQSQEKDQVSEQIQADQEENGFIPLGPRKKKSDQPIDPSKTTHTNTDLENQQNVDPAATQNEFSSITPGDENALEVSCEGACDAENVCAKICKNACDQEGADLDDTCACYRAVDERLSCSDVLKDCKKNCEVPFFGN